MMQPAAQPAERRSWLVPVSIVVFGVLVLAIAVARQIRPASDGLRPIAAVPAFEFTDQSGRAYGLNDLVRRQSSSDGGAAEKSGAGQVWIADFIFTSCAGPCPIMTLQMAEVQKSLSDEPAVRFVSFSVDPERDTPAVLADYAKKFNAGAGWAFLTGERARIYDLSTKGFFLPVVEQRAAASRPIDASIAEEESPAIDPEHSILHSTRFVLVDHVGRIRGYFDGMEPADCERLARAARVLARDMRVPPAAAPLPAVNATLNACCFVLLVAGFVAIRSKHVDAHRVLMASACVTSLLFLASYVFYHLVLGAGATKFAGPPAMRAVYVAILGSHTVLAAAIVPLVVITISRALRERFDRHRRIARITLPLWLYVSVTGVIVYLMLYHIFPASGVRL